MANMSDYLENALTDHLFRSATFAKPTTLGFALFTDAPSDSGGGTEVSGAGYARATLSPSDSNWYGTHGATSGSSSGTGGASSNAVAVNFPTPGVGGWGTVVAWGVYDAAIGGNLLLWAPLTVSKTINQGDGVRFDVGQMQVTFA